MDPVTITFGGLVGFVIFIITLVSIVKNRNHGTFGKFAWILVAFFLSVFGSILWLLFGRGRISR